MPIRPPKGFIEESDPRVCQIGHPAPPWLINYADLMTEMVCFFVILYALSAALSKDVQNAREQIQKMMAEEELVGEVKVDREGMKISLEEQGEMAHFKSGYAELTPVMRSALGKIAPTLRDLARKNHEIIIEGHTDDVPMHDQYYASNWELSTARATAVVEHMIRDNGLPAGCMAAIGYGKHRPIAPNDTLANRARNRRVVFFVKNPPMSKGESCRNLSAPAAGPPRKTPEEGK
ncbi:MAG: flagellar motor protein MotB [Elusimicrobiota bacterium]